MDEDEAQPARRSSKRKKDKKHHHSKKKSKKHRRRSKKSASPESSSSDEPINETSSSDHTAAASAASEAIDFGRDYAHKEAMEIFKKSLSSVLAYDPLLNDLPTDITLEEVNSLIALEHGQAITVFIEKEDRTSLAVIVHQNGTVADLKKAVERATNLKLAREKKNTRVSWKYVWKTYWLFAHGQKLKQDHQLLRECSINNNDCVSFIKRLKEK